MTRDFCELPLHNASDEEIAKILREAKTVAVVGLSDNPEKDSYQVAAYLKAAGFRVIPVNPHVREVLGEKAYPSLAAIPPEVSIDVVDIFRRPEFIPAIVDEAIARGAKAVWMQRGLAHNAAADKARAAGLAVVMDRCMMVEHRRLSAGR